MSDSFIIPNNIDSLPKVEQVLIYRGNGDSVLALHPPGKGKNGKTGLAKKLAPLDEDGVYHHFGNGRVFNVGLMPRQGHLIANLDGADREQVERFIEVTPSLSDIPRVRTHRGYHLHFLCHEVPSKLVHINIVPGVNLQFITPGKYVVAPPSTHEHGMNYAWVKTGEVRLWTWQQIAAAFHLREVPSTSSYTTVAPTTTASEAVSAAAAAWPSDNRPVITIFEGGSDVTASLVYQEMKKMEIFFHQAGKLVMYDKKSKATRLLTVDQDRMRSVLDEFFQVRRQTRASRVEGERATASREEAAGILKSPALTRQLDTIIRVIQHPVLTSEGEVITEGEFDAMLVDSRCGKIPEVPLEEAKMAIVSLFKDFQFTTPSDLSRAIAHLHSPAMAFGDLLNGERVPFFVVEADKPGAGKGVLQNVVATVYGEIPGTITNIERGVGGNDESLSRHLLDGVAFIQFDNWRHKMASEMLESVLTEPTVQCRALHQAAATPTKGAFFMMTSNGAELTPDLADRSCFVRIIKQEKGYQWSKFGPQQEGVRQHVSRKWEYYLGCVYSVLRAWLNAGKPESKGAYHRFHTWAGAMDWIVQNIFFLPPLLDGHEQILQSATDDVYSFLRQLAFHVRDEDMLGEPLETKDLVSLAIRHGVTLRGVNMNGENAYRPVGSRISPHFKKTNSLHIDNRFTVTRQISTVKRTDGNGYRERPSYTFFATTPSSNGACCGLGVETGGKQGIDGISDESCENTAGERGAEASPQQAPQQALASSEPGAWCGTEVPPYQWLTNQNNPIPHQPHQATSSFYQINSINEKDDVFSLVEKKKGRPGVVISDNLSPLVSPAEKSGTFLERNNFLRVVRNKSDLADLAETLAGIPDLLYLDLEPSKFEDGIWLLSIQTPHHGSWLIDVEKVGGHEAVSSALKDILESRRVCPDYKFYKEAWVPTEGNKPCPGGIRLDGVWHRLDENYGEDPLVAYFGIHISPWFPPGRGKSDFTKEEWQPKSCRELYNEIRDAAAGEQK